VEGKGDIASNQEEGEGIKKGAKKAFWRRLCSYHKKKKKIPPNTRSGPQDFLGTVRDLKESLTAPG